MGYYAEQSTKPQTLGYSLADSPVGMMAWIYEKLVSLTDSYPWEDDEGMVTWFLIGTYSLDRGLANLQLFCSADVGVGILVLPLRTCGICQDILRALKGRSDNYFSKDNYPDWNIILPQGAREVPKSVSVHFMPSVFHNHVTY